MGSSPGPLDPTTRSAIGRILFDNAEELLAVLLLGLIGGVLALQVLLRTFLSAPLSWPEELSQFFFVWASALGAIGAVKRFGLVRVEAIFERFPVSVRRWLDVVVLASIAFVLAILGWYGWQMASRSTYAAASLPITWWWMYAAAPAFSILAFARLLQAQVFRYRFAFIEVELSRGEEIADARGPLE
jgi:TRAP-type C4-dicarboxylate transport system permease small subunit